MCSRMDSFNAAALGVKLPHLDAWNERRRMLAAHYDAGLRAVGVAGGVDPPLTLPSHADAAHIFHQYVVRARDRGGLARHLADAGVATQIYYPTPLHRQPALAACALTPYPLDVAERATGDVLALPIYPELADEQLDYVVTTIAAFYATG